jgi:DNA-binding response OmpR family regulator
LVDSLERLGHEPIVLQGGPDVPPPADLMLLEPTSLSHVDQARIARERDPVLPIIWLNMLPPEASFVTLGPNAYLTKPFTIAELGTTIAAVLASGEARSAP